MRKVEVSSDIKTTPESIINAFTDSAMLGEWWDVERVLIEKRPGGTYTLAWSISNNGFGFVSTGIIKEYNNSSTLVVEKFVYMNPDKSILGPMTLTIRASKNGDTSRLYLCQDGYQSGGDWDWYFEAVKQAWPATVETLKKYLEEVKR